MDGMGWDGMGWLSQIIDTLRAPLVSIINGDSLFKIRYCVYTTHQSASISTDQIYSIYRCAFYFSFYLCTKLISFSVHIGSVPYLLTKTTPSTMFTTTFEGMMPYKLVRSSTPSTVDPTNAKRQAQAVMKMMKRHDGLQMTCANYPQ